MLGFLDEREEARAWLDQLGPVLEDVGEGRAEDAVALSRGLGEAMPGLEISALSVRLQERGV